MTQDAIEKESEIKFALLSINKNKKKCLVLKLILINFHNLLNMKEL